MSRMIRIISCADCPRRDHKGGFGAVAYIPVCRSTGRELPYTAETGGIRMLVAVQKPGIPDWCPLEKPPEAT